MVYLDHENMCLGWWIAFLATPQKVAVNTATSVKLLLQLLSAHK
jgi:hypothetical protein